MKGRKKRKGKRKKEEEKRKKWMSDVRCLMSEVLRMGWKTD